MRLKLNGLREDMGEGGNGLAPAGDPYSLLSYLTALGSIVGVPVADETALAAIEEKDRADGQFVKVGTKLWYRDDSSSASANAGTVVISDDSATGRWLVFASGTLASSLALTTTGNGAALVGLIDAAGRISAATAELGIAELAGRLAQSPADLTAIKAISATARTDGMLAVLTSDGSKWRFVAASSLTGDDFLVATPAAGTGRWFREDTEVDITAAVTSATADAATLYTAPTGWVLAVGVPFWKVGTTMTTASAGAAGLSSSNAGLSTKGDLLGGASGDVVATLVSTGAYAKGTVGAKVGKPAAVVIGGETIRYDLITGTFTGGAMTAHAPVKVLVRPAS